MAFTTHIQQVLAYLKAGHPLQPVGGIPTMQGPTASPVVPPSTKPVPVPSPTAPKVGM